MEQLKGWVSIHRLPIKISFSEVSRVALAILTRVSITGTSTRTPTTVARAAPDSRPKSDMATATASSKKLLAPIMTAGAATSCLSLHALAQRYARMKMEIRSMQSRGI